VTSHIPKAEIHCHFEGSMSPDLVRRMAARNGIELPGGLFDERGEFAWTDFHDFLRTYDLAADCLSTAEDARDAMYEYLASCAAEGAIYVEVFTSPDHAAAKGLGFAEQFEAIVQGIDDAERDFGIIGRMIPTCVRHLGPENALRVAEQVVAERHPYIVGFGMGGDELAHTFEDFRPAFSLVDDAGLPCTAHAGEVDGAQSVRDALNHLPLQRLGHGVRAIEDSSLVEEIANRGIVLEICPRSNFATNVYQGYHDHPLPKLMAAGCKVTLNSDDPPYFDTSIGREYAHAASGFGLADDVLIGFTRTAIESAFVDDAVKASLMARLENFEAPCPEAPS
jgi:adenosine deaminase